MSIPKKSVSNGRKGVSSGKRLNSKPTYIVAGIVSMTLFGIYYAAMSRSTAPSLAEDSSGDEMFSVVATPSTQIEFLKDRPDGLAGVNRDLFKDPNAEEKGRESDLDDRMLDAYERQQLKKMDDENRLRERMISRQIELAQAAVEGDMVVTGFSSQSEFAKLRPKKEKPFPDSYTEVEASALGSPNYLLGQQAGSAQGLGNLSAQQLEQIASQLPPEYQAILQTLITSAAAGTTPSGSIASTSTNTAGVDASNQYLDKNRRDFTLRNELESPRTRFEIKTGTILPAAMISAANSDLPGDIVGQITQNVYDTQTGKHLLVPQGTKLFGRYDAFTQLGQERLLIVWDRLIFPDAETLDIGGMQGYDGFGQSGVKDKVNTHFVRTLFNALLISVVNASGEALADAASEIDNSFVLNLTTNFSETASKPFDEYLRNRLKIRPTLQIRSGFRFNVMVSKDISLDAPYRYGYKLKLARP